MPPLAQLACHDGMPPAKPLFMEAALGSRLALTLALAAVGAAIERRLSRSNRFLQDC
jgi:hypothetical protein